MNYLGLTNSFLIETGVSDQVASLVGAPDDVAQAAHWINSAWASFQRSRLWPFRRAEGTVSVTPGTVSYTFSTLGRAEGDIIIPHSFYSALGDITQVPYTSLRARRRAGGVVDTSRVSNASIRSGKLETFPDVDAADTVAYDYWTGVQTLTLGTDIPYGLPADFHSLIVHLAIAKYAALAGGQEGANLYAHHGGEYARIRNEYILHAGLDDETDTTPARNTLL